MSHVTTSAVMSTTGLGRTDIASGAQLASNERFHDFLASYVHPETPRHSETSQKTSIVKSQSATKAEPLASERTAQRQSPKAETSTTSPVRPAAVSHLEEHTVLPKAAAAPQSQPLATAVQKGASDGSKEQPQDSSVPNKSPQSDAQKSSDKSLPKDGLSPTENESSQTEGDDFVDNNTTSLPVKEASSAADGKGESVSNKTNQISDLIGNNNSRVISDNGILEENKKEQNIELNQSENSIKIENNSFIDSDSIPSEKMLPEVLNETTPETQAENTTAPPSDEEKISRHADPHVQLYQEESSGNNITHIEMNVGENEKIHIEINGNISKEHRIHINTDNPGVYQSLKEDKSTLIEALSDNSSFVSGTQSTVKADIQISLSLPAFLDISSRDERQGGNSRSSGSLRGDTPEAPTSVAERRFLRGVVDLTV